MFINLCDNLIVSTNDKNLIIYSSKLEGTLDQYKRLDSAIRTGRFVRNSVFL